MAKTRKGIEFVKWLIFPFIILSPLIVIFGVIGLVDYKSNQETRRTYTCIKKIENNLGPYVKVFLKLQHANKRHPTKNCYDAKITLLDVNNERLFQLKEFQYKIVKKILATEPEEVRSLAFIEVLEPVRIATYQGAIHIIQSNGHSINDDPLYDLYLKNDRKIDLYCTPISVKVVDKSSGCIIAKSVFYSANFKNLPSSISYLKRYGENFYKTSETPSDQTWVVNDDKVLLFGAERERVQNFKILKWIFSKYCQNMK